MNDGLELGADLVRALDSLFGRFRPPQAPPSAQLPPRRLTAYQIFGLPEDASEAEFKKRHRELVNMYHPDKGSGSDAMLKIINQAWDEIRENHGWK